MKKSASITIELQDIMNYLVSNKIISEEEKEITKVALTKDKSGIIVELKEVALKEKEFTLKEMNPFFSMKIEDMGMDGRLLSSLKKGGIQTGSDILKLNRIKAMKLKNFGKRCLISLEDILDQYNLPRLR